MKSTMRPIGRVLWRATAIRSSVLVVACFGAAGLWAAAQSAAPSTGRAPASAGPADPKLIEDLVLANHILAIEGVFDAMGQVSVRHDRDPTRYLMAYARAPELVTQEDIMEFDLTSDPIEARDRPRYKERFIHGEIYKARPDVVAVVHNHSRFVVSSASAAYHSGPWPTRARSSATGCQSSRFAGRAA